MSPRPPRRLFQIGIAITSLSLTLVLAELALRAVEFAQPGGSASDRRGFHEPRPDRAWLYGLRPGAEGTLEISGDTLYRINSDGFRDLERKRPKPAGVFRIILLGDSVGFGYGIDASEIFTTVLERKLAEYAGGPQIEVLNLAVSGYNPYTEAALLRDVGRSYQPDLVVVQFCINDLNDPTLHFDAQARLHLGTIPDAAFPDPEARRSEHQSASAALSLCRRSRICARVDDLLLATTSSAPDKAAERAAAVAVDGSDGPEWPWIEALYGEMAETSRSLGAEFAVLAFPYPAQLNGLDGSRDATSLRGAADGNEARDRVPQPVRARLLDAGKRNGWHTIDPLPRFRRAAAQRQKLFIDWWHPTSLGHRLAAEEILASLACAELLPAATGVECGDRPAD